MGDRSGQGLVGSSRRRPEGGSYRLDVPDVGGGTGLYAVGVSAGAWTPPTRPVTWFGVDASDSDSDDLSELHPSRRNELGATWLRAKANVALANATVQGYV